MKLTLLQVSEWMGAERSAGTDGAALATGYSIDSRTLLPGDVFFAVKGERFDGHDFVDAAFGRGAIAAVVSRSQARRMVGTGQVLLAVEDPLKALQHLAAAVRRRWGRRVIGITGSAGKTTTKEAVALVLESKYSVLKSQGNLNNEYGLPLQLLRLTPEHDMAVIEMGMNHAGEIRALAEIARPNWGVVSNVAPVHVGNFADGIAGVARAKYELVESLPAEGGVAFLNCDDAYVGQFGRDFKGHAVYFGTGACADPRAEDIQEHSDGVSFTAVTMQQDEAVRTPVKLGVLGRHNVLNALAAIAVGCEAGVAPAAAAEALARLAPGDKRGERLSIAGATILNDSYNSNPRALDSMVDALLAVAGKRHIVVAGEMLELGEQAAALHRECGASMAAKKVDVVIGVRGEAVHLVEAARQGGAEAVFAATPEEAGSWLKQHMRAGDVILLKASRGVRLENALRILQPSAG